MYFKQFLYLLFTTKVTVSKFTEIGTFLCISNQQTLGKQGNLKYVSERESLLISTTTWKNKNKKSKARAKLQIPRSTWASTINNRRGYKSFFLWSTYLGKAFCHVNCKTGFSTQFNLLYHSKNLLFIVLGIYNFEQGMLHVFPSLS